MKAGILYLVASVILFATPMAWSDSSMTFRIGGVSTTASGSIYKTKSQGSGLVAADFSINYGQNWRLFTSFSTTITGDVLGLGVGGAYHFRPYQSKTEQVGTNVTIGQTYKWSPYIGFELTMSRIQMSLVQNQNTANSDVVLASLVGTTLHGGSYYTYSKNLSLVFDGFVTYGVSSTISTSQMGLSFGFLVKIP